MSWIKFKEQEELALGACKVVPEQQTHTHTILTKFLATKLCLWKQIKRLKLFIHFSQHWKLVRVSCFVLNPTKHENTPWSWLTWRGKVFLLLTFVLVTSTTMTTTYVSDNKSNTLSLSLIHSASWPLMGSFFLFFLGCFENFSKILCHFSKQKRPLKFNFKEKAKQIHLPLICETVSNFY